MPILHKALFLQLPRFCDLCFKRQHLQQIQIETLKVVYPLQTQAQFRCPHAQILPNPGPVVIELLTVVKKSQAPSKNIEYVNIDIKHYSMVWCTQILSHMSVIHLYHLSVLSSHHHRSVSPTSTWYLSSMESFIPCIWKTQSEAIFANCCLGQFFFCFVCINVFVSLQLVIMYN